MVRIAFVVGEDFEDSELRVPLDGLLQAGHVVEILGDRAGVEVHGKRRQETIRIDAAAEERDPWSYDALVIPGGYSPDHLRCSPGVVSFVRDFVGTGRTVAAVCHGPQLLIEAEAVRGKRMTSWPSVRTDLENAGARWVDAEVVVDGTLITSRKPADLPAFTREILAQVENAVHRAGEEVLLQAEDARP
ncbi:MAG TPA: type 1 glutamine amidotransferase domain-containing protein [Kofleriaceae bacterium]|jgi:protease I|nr:type 1 glutamine amidotransferase domain-containing protein [Kofleriaceae bacterium]